MKMGSLHSSTENQLRENVAEGDNEILPDTFSDVDKEIYYTLKRIFPNLDKDNLKLLVKNPPFVIGAFESKDNILLKFVDCLGRHKTKDNFEMKTFTIDETYEYLQDIFSDADSSYIYAFAKRNNNNHEAILKFIEDHSKNPTYPTTEKCLERSELRETFIKNFETKRFVEIFNNNPIKYFEDPKRKCNYDYSALEFLRKVYCDYKVNKLHLIYKTLNFNLSLTIKKLDTESVKNFRKKNYELDVLLNTNNTDLLLEVVYLKNKNRIIKYLEIIDEQEYKEIQRCIKNKSFIECQCCLTDYIPSRIITCNSNHSFCKTCVKKSVEVKIEEGNYTLNCILQCGSQFKITDIQRILYPAIFKKFCFKWQEQEIRKAQIEGLVTCPFCPFASIPPSNTNIFECMNPECRIISCRLCKKRNHAPDLCDEKVKARHRLEEEMTKALLRECYRCGKPYIKTEGCNRITCVCGAWMCYVCKQPIKDYSHFNNNECKLWTDNITVNEQRVQNVAQRAARDMVARYPELRRDIIKLTK